MRKITKQTVEAFENNKNFKSGNMEVSSDQFTNRMWLHGNLIALKDHVNNVFKVSLAGWNTPTTRDRLNGITGVSIHTKNGQAYLNGNKMDNNSWYII
jgi:hypothetical protein